MINEKFKIKLLPREKDQEINKEDLTDEYKNRCSE